MRAVSAIAIIVLAGCAGVPDVDETELPELPLEVPSFAKVVQVSDRWSGEPSILAMRDGTLLITGVSGMTRYAEDPTDIPGNFGASYIWRSTDDGDTWALSALPPGPAADLLPYRNAVFGVEGDLAEDEAGRAYFTDLTFLATNGVAASDDSGATWLAAQSPVVGAGADRPWVAALGDGEVWLKWLAVGSGHKVARSTDGGMTFLEEVDLPSCSQADFGVDVEAQEVLLACTGGSLSILKTGRGPQNWQRMPLVQADGEPVNGSTSFVFPMVTAAGNGQYIYAWAQPNGNGADVRISYSSNAGTTWSPAIQMSAPGKTAVFPWVDANLNGDVAVVWYEADEGGDPNAIDATWRLHHASLQIENGTLGNATVIVHEDPVHEGSICTAGLGCVLGGRSDDRRLLDFFEVDVDEEGRSHITWTSTLGDVPTVWYGQVTDA